MHYSAHHVTGSAVYIHTQWKTTFDFSCMATIEGDIMYDQIVKGTIIKA